MYFITVSKNCTIREGAQIKLLSLKDCFSVESFFSLGIEIIRHIGLRYHRIQYFWDDDFYSVSESFIQSPPTWPNFAEMFYNGISAMSGSGRW